MRTDEQLALAAFLGAIMLVAFLDVLIIAWHVRLYVRRRAGGETEEEHRAVPRFERFLGAKWTAAALALVTAAGIACVLWGRFVEPNRVVLRRYEVRTPKLPAGSRVRVLHLSDVHYEGPAPRIGRALALIRALDPPPDLVALTGDYLNRGDERNRRELTDFLRALALPDATFGILGNWDARFDPSRELAAAEVEMVDGLLRSAVVGGHRIAILGAGRAELLAEFIRGCGPETFTLVLAHSPDAAPEAARAGVDLVLCGHTHGGQVCLPLVGALVTLTRVGRRFAGGMIELGETKVCVSRGLGMEGGPAPRVRFFCPPEVVVIDLIGTGKPPPKE